MKIAIPAENGKLCSHFGGAPEFFIADIDEAAKSIRSSETLVPPEHAPGVYPEWLRNMNVTQVIGGGIGARAQVMLEAASIGLITGAPAIAVEELIQMHLDGKLLSVAVKCDHDHHDCH